MKSILPGVLVMRLASTRNTEHWFSLEVPDNTPITLAPRGYVAYEWLPYQEAAKKCFSPSNGEAILKLFQQTKASANKE